MSGTLSALLKSIPKKVKVGAYKWSVVLEGEGDGTILGQTNWASYEISLFPNSIPTPDLLVGVLLHELLHVIYGEEAITGEDAEETLVKRFEFGLIALFRDNPKLIGWINKGLK